MSFFWANLSFFWANLFMRTKVICQPFPAARRVAAMLLIICWLHCHRTECAIWEVVSMHAAILQSILTYIQSEGNYVLEYT